MHKSVKACVKCGGYIECTKKVKQGDMCNPLLFLLFTSELGNICLLFANDIVLMSEIVIGLHNQLNVLYNVSVTLSLNVNKINNIVVINKNE